jgi:hypothetical protein
MSWISGLSSGCASDDGRERRHEGRSVAREGGQRAANELGALRSGQHTPRDGQRSIDDEHRSWQDRYCSAHDGRRRPHEGREGSHDESQSTFDGRDAIRDRPGSSRDAAASGHGESDGADDGHDAPSDGRDRRHNAGDRCRDTPDRMTDGREADHVDRVRAHDRPECQHESHDTAVAGPVSVLGTGRGCARTGQRPPPRTATLAAARGTRGGKGTTDLHRLLPTLGPGCSRGGESHHAH